MLYNVTKIYVLNNQVLYVDEGEISRDSANYNQIDVITNVTGFGVEIAFEFPNGIFSNRIGLIQQPGTVKVPSGISELSSIAGEDFSVYRMLIPQAVLSAITSKVSQTLFFSLRFSTQITNLREFEELGDFPSVGKGDEVYKAEDTGKFYVWDGTEYEEKTTQQANALIITEGQAYKTEVGTLAVQGTIEGEPVALAPSFFQNEIVSSFNNLVALYNQINALITDSEEGLANKVNRTGDTMSGQLQFSNAAATRLILGNNNITTDGSINATTFANGNNSSDAVKFSNFATLFDVTPATPAGNQTWIDTVSAALSAKFAGVLTVAQLGDFFARKDGSNSYTGNLNMGNQSITNVNLVDGVDVSALNQTVQSLQGSFVFRGVINNTTQQVEADTSLLTTRLGVLLERQPQTGDVLKDSDGGEWYYDGSAWRFMGQASIDLSILATTSQLTDGLNLKEDKTNTGDRSYTEENVVTNAETFTKSIDDLDIAIGNREYTTQDNLTNGETITESLDSLDQIKMDVDGLNSEIDELTFLNKADTERESKLFVEGCCIKYVHDDGLEIRLGKELLFRNFKNATGATIPKGTPVMFAGQDGLGGDTLIKPATVDNQEFWNLIDLPQAFFGLASQDIASGEFGAITHFGDVEGLSFNFGPGSVVYFDPSTGGLTTTRPNGVNPEIIIGVVRQQAGNNATIFVRPTIYPRLQDLMGVKIEDIADKHGLVYDNELGYFVNKKIVLDADLFTNGKINADLIPFQFDDVIQGYLDDGVFYEDQALENAITGEQGKLYIDLTTNKLYRFDGSVYVLIIDASEINSINDIPDVVITTVANDEALVYNSSTGKWENQVIPRTVTALTDTTIDNTQTGQVLTWNGTAWVNQTLPTQALNDLTDVVVATPVADNLLVYNGSNFVNQAGSSSLVGLNNVQNFGIATQGEAEAGTADNKYMTPERTKQAIATNNSASATKLNTARTINGTNFDGTANITTTNWGTSRSIQIGNTSKSVNGGSNVNYTLAEIGAGTANVFYLTTTIATTDWSGTDPVTAVKTVSGVLSTDKPLIDIDLSAVAFADVEDKQTEYAKIYRVAATDDDEITFYALEAPTEELVIQIKVVR